MPRSPVLFFFMTVFAAYGLVSLTRGLPGRSGALHLAPDVRFVGEYYAGNKSRAASEIRVNTRTCLREMTGRDIPNPFVSSTSDALIYIFSNAAKPDPDFIQKYSEYVRAGIPRLQEEIRFLPPSELEKIAVAVNLMKKGDGAIVLLPCVIEKIKNGIQKKGPST